MAKTHFILCGFGDLGTKIFSTLLQINAEESRKSPADRNILDISIVDTRSLEDLIGSIETRLPGRFKDYSDISYNAEEHLGFLRNNFFQDLRDGCFPEGLCNRINPARSIVYLAIDPDKYLDALKQYRPISNIFVLEKPLARESEEDQRPSDKAQKIVEFAGRHSGVFGKVFVPVDHYLGKYMFAVLERIRETPQFGEVVQDANTIVFSFLEKRTDDPHDRPYFARTGIIADMMPHVLALLMKIFDSRFEVEPTRVVRWSLESYDKLCQDAGIKERKETHAEIEFRLYETGHPAKTVIVRIGKGVCDEDRTVAFIDSRRHIIEMKLPFRDNGSEQAGHVLLKTPGGETQLIPGGLPPERWDKSWYNIIRSLMDKQSGMFLTMEDAKKIVTIIEDIQRSYHGALIKYKEGELPDEKKFDWRTYRWWSETEYAVIFNFNGVLLASQEIDRRAWKWVFSQLRHNYDEAVLFKLMNTGLPTKEILLGEVPQLLSNPMFASNWAVAKEQWQVTAFLEVEEGKSKPKEGVQELLRTLTSKRTPVGLYSMFSHRSVLEILQHGHLKQFFSAVVTPDIHLMRRRSGVAFLDCLEELISRLGVSPQQCFLLEDSAGCVWMATDNLGVTCIGIGEENSAQLKASGAICCVNDHNKLLPIFQTSTKVVEVVQRLRELDPEL